MGMFSAPLFVEWHPKLIESRCKNSAFLRKNIIFAQNIEFIVLTKRKMKQLLITLCVLLASVAVAQQADNYPPDKKDVKIVTTNLPIVWIDVDGAMIQRDSRITGRMKIIHNGDSRRNFGDTATHRGQHIDYEGYIGIRYRGNSSFGMSDKKPYSFHTMTGPLGQEGVKKQKVDILGMGKASKWILLAPYADRSMIRDLLTFTVAKPWMEYVPEGKLVEVFLDGTYYGVYVLCEAVSKAKTRLNLDDPGEEGDALTGGYLMEVDCDEEGFFTSHYQPVFSDGTPIPGRYNYYQYKSPEVQDLTPNQIKYINDRIDDMEGTLASADYMDPVNGYRKYVDVQNFIDYQLFTELGNNVDGYRLSGKFFKRRDSIDQRFKMVLWDFNLAFGGARHNESYRTDTWMYQSNDITYPMGEIYLVPFWWQKLNSDPAYTAQLKARWKQFRRSNLSDEAIMGTVDSLVNVINKYGAETRNSQAWPRWKKWVWPNYYTSSSFSDEISYLKRWISDRISWMDEQLGYLPYDYIRGDADGNGSISIADVVAIIDYLIAPDENSIVIEAADCDFNGEISIADVVLLIDYILYKTWD